MPEPASFLIAASLRLSRSVGDRESSGDGLGDMLDLWLIDVWLIDVHCTEHTPTGRSENRSEERLE